MSKVKLIPSVLLMALVLAGTLLPARLHFKNRKSVTVNKKTETTTSIKDKNSSTDITLKYLTFDSLEEFFSDSQIDNLKNQFVLYLKENNMTEISSVTFIPEKTSYPYKTTVKLFFVLSDDSNLPVFYDTTTGVFFFSEEKISFQSETKNYTKKTDETLSSITSKQIEERTESGYDDTTTDEEVQP